MSENVTIYVEIRGYESFQYDAQEWVDAVDRGEVGYLIDMDVSDMETEIIVRGPDGGVVPW